MSKAALEDLNYSAIKAYALNPESATLNPQQMFLYDRLVSMAKIIDKNPLQNQAVALHKAKYSEITYRQASNDYNLAIKLFNTIHQFDFDFWHTWLINDIVRNIERCRVDSTVSAFKVIALEHANLIKAIGEKPPDLEDNRRMEKQAFYFLINYNNTTVKIDVDNLHNLPEATIRELNKAIFTGQEITEAEVLEIFNT